MRYKRGHESLRLRERFRAPSAKAPRRPRLDVALLDHLLTTVPFGFAFLDRELRCVRVSAALASFSGLPIQGHVGRTLREVLGERHWALVEPYCDAALRGIETSDVEIAGPLAIASDTRHYALASFCPVSHKGEAIGISLGITDISERVQAEIERMSLTAQIHAAGAERRGYLVEMLAALTEGKLRICHSEDELPRERIPVAPALPLAPNVLSLFRHQVIDAAAWLKFPDERTADFVLGVGEALDNALVHAEGGAAQVFVDEESGVLQVRVDDTGGGISEGVLHRAALERGYTTAGSLGHGFFLILNTCDRVWLLTSPSGTTVVLEQDRKPPLPEWLFER